MPPIGPKFGILDVERRDAVVVEVDERQIVHRLQQKVRRVVVDPRARMVCDGGQEPLPACPVKDIFAGVQFKPDVDAGIVIGVQDRQPAAGQFGKGGLNQACRALRPGVQIGERKRSGETDRPGQAQIAGGGRGLGDLIHRPGLPRLRIAVHRSGRKGVEGRIIGRVHGDQLALQVGRKLGDRQPGVGTDAAHLVGIGRTLRAEVQIEQPGVPAWDLDALVAQPRRPGGDCGQRIERCCIARELRQENPRTLDRRHAAPAMSDSITRCRISTGLANSLSSCKNKGARCGMARCASRSACVRQFS